MIFYVGDIHSSLSAIKTIDVLARSAGCEIVVQVGDFGMMFAGPDRPSHKCAVKEYFDNRESGPVWYTCGGNHDNWPHWNSIAPMEGGLTELAKDCYYVHRGQGIELDGVKHLFFGGAESTDRQWRTEGIDWWPEETPSSYEFADFFDTMESYKPVVVVTHDAPLQIGIWKYNRNNSATPKNLDNVFNLCEHKPAYWMFGHHHIMDKWAVGNTVFYCCGLHGEYVRI